MSWEDTDLIRMVAYFAAIFLNREAAFLLYVEFMLEVAWYYVYNGFAISLIMSLSYAALSTANIKVHTNVRLLLIAMSCVNFISAIDYLVAPKTETLFFACYPYLINFLDVLIIFYLLPRGGFQIVVRYLSFGSRGNSGL